MKGIENKNELIKISANQIKVLEKNASNFVQVINELKQKEETLAQNSSSNKPSENHPHTKSNEEVILALEVKIN